MTDKTQTNEELKKAQELIKEQEQKEREACSAEINKVLEKYGFEMRASNPQILLFKK